MRSVFVHSSLRKCSGKACCDHGRRTFLERCRRPVSGAFPQTETRHGPFLFLRLMAQADWKQEKELIQKAMALIHAAD